MTRTLLSGSTLFSAQRGLCSARGDSPAATSVSAYVHDEIVRCSHVSTCSARSCQLLAHAPPQATLLARAPPLARAPAACRRTGGGLLRTHRGTSRPAVGQLYGTQTALFLAGGVPLLWPAVFLLLLLRISPRQSAHARTHARTTTNDSTCGSPAWLAGTLHWGGSRGERSPSRRPPPDTTPIAMPLQGGRPERPGPFVS